MRGLAAILIVLIAIVAAMRVRASKRLEFAAAEEAAAADAEARKATSDDAK